MPTLNGVRVNLTRPSFVMHGIDMPNGLMKPIATYWTPLVLSFDSFTEKDKVKGITDTNILNIVWSDKERWILRNCTISELKGPFLLLAFEHGEYLNEVISLGM